MQPYLNQGYHLFVDNFYTSMILFKTLFTQGVLATGTVMETRRDFPPVLKNSKEWAKGKDRGAMRWEPDPPCLALQWIDNKVVSLLTTIDNANNKIQVNRKSKTAGVWSTKVVYQPKAVSNYNKYMNAVDRSDQILATNNVLRKCMRWWKTLFFHLIDIAVVNSFILFREHQANYNNITTLMMKPFTGEEIVRQLCDLPEYDDPPTSTRSKPVPKLGDFEVVHMPEFSHVRRLCVVCYKQGRGELKIASYCSAPQCEGKYMHITKERNCFKEFHSRELSHLLNPFFNSLLLLLHFYHVVVTLFTRCVLKKNDKKNNQ